MSSSATLTSVTTSLRSDRARYDVVAILAESPSATILRAWDRELSEPVVLKVLSPAVARDRQTVERLKAEIRLARRVRHPSVAKVYDLEEWDGRLCITMELIEGVTLESHLRRGPMSFAETAALLRTIALALHSAHELGVVHRDLKPANIMLDLARRPYLLDFGIALSTDEPAMSDSDIVRGTPAYMAPERWKGAPGLPASDLYSLGVMAYEMISGHPPFATDSLRVLMKLHLHSPPPSLGNRVPDLPAGFESLIMRLLHKQTSARPGSSEVAQILRAMMPHIQPAGRRGSVLIVEDEPSVRRALAEYFSHRGLQVAEARNGVDGIVLARRNPPDIIFLDVAMPGMDGVAVLRELKADAATAGRPVVMLSGSLDPQHPVLARGLGAVAFLNKPVNPDVLDLVIDKYLG